MKKILLIFILLFISFLTSFADWKTDIDKGDYKLFSEVYPDKQDIYEFQSVKLNDKGEFVIEYTKDHYDKLLKVYGGRNMLIFDPKNTEKYKFNTKTEFKGDSVFITILKDDKLDLAYEIMLKCDNYDSCDDEFNSFDGYTDFYFYDLFPYYGWNGEDEDELEFKVIKLINEGKFKEINKLLSKEDLEKGYGVHNGVITFDINSYSNKIGQDFLLKKYKKGNFQEKISFSVKDKNKIIDFFKDNIYYQNYFGWGWKAKKEGNKKLFILNNDLIIKDNVKDINFNLKNKSKNRYSWIDYRSNNEFDITDRTGKNTIRKTIKINLKQFQYKNVFNVSELLRYIHQLGYFKGLKIKDIYSIDYGNGNKNFYFYFGYPEEDILPIVNNIKSPKNVSTNPYLVSVNFILALLYLLAFYFTTQLFNSYFEELASKSKWNEKIGNFTTKYLKLPFQKLYNYLITISKNKKLKGYLNKIKDFLIKHEHHIYIILGFLLLGIIGQIVVDDFDILSLKGWFTIFIMMFILAFITVFKDLLLYLFNKKESKSKLKLENMPLGFIFAGIVAVFGRWIGLIPGVMFGSVIKLNPKDSITERKTTKPKLLFKVLLIVFLVGLACWMLTILFDSQSFIYKFLIVTYFGLINDVFFALLPFGMLWGIFILKDKKLKVKWFLLTFVIFFFLLHTIMNSDGDLNKLLQFDGNFAILVLILIFWMIITGGLYYKTKKVIK